jgi:hypothetical protein
MARIQILPLPDTVTGEQVRTPFAVIVDQAYGFNADDIAAWQQFRDDCSASAILVTDRRIDVASHDG